MRASSGFSVILEKARGRVVSSSRDNLHHLRHFLSDFGEAHKRSIASARRSASGLRHRIEQVFRGHELAFERWAHGQRFRDGDDLVYAPAETEIEDAVRSALNSEQLKHWKFGDNENSALIGTSVTTKRELLDLLATNETERFFETVVERLEELCLLIPAIDAALAKTPTK